MTRKRLIVLLTAVALAGAGKPACERGGADTSTRLRLGAAAAGGKEIGDICE